MAKERKFKTEPNQKVIRVNKTKVNKGKTYTIIDNEVLFNAMQELTFNEFKLFMYIASNQDGYEFALSTKHVAEVTGGDQRELQKKVNSLIEKGYLVCEGGNKYTFYEGKQHSNICGKTTECYEEIPHSKDTPMRENNIGGCGNSTEWGVEKQHTPMWKNNIEIIQDNTNNNTIYNTNIDCNVLPVSKEQVDIPYPTNVEPTKEETRAIDSLNSNSFTLSDLIEEFKKETGATVRKTTIANKTKDLQSRNDINLDIVRELFKKHLNKNSTSDKPINVIFTGMLKYANDNYDKAVEEDRVYKRKQEQEQARTEREIARMNDDYCYVPEPDEWEEEMNGKRVIVRKNDMTGNLEVVKYIS